MTTDEHASRMKDEYFSNYQDALERVSDLINNGQSEQFALSIHESQWRLFYPYRDSE